ncbi:uncharacterized protein LOC127850731 [Dreissena polymorpha]|uniref:Uncharacterized protein n=1 Tax=Dreissena polymorpha TaxID=45954 RepID=A0A9D4HXC3_DREPO|nr:uncharacterized protein LOC127850731 [Dreissena polymorpha]XP_052239972.1 uncharacterized protein LOC127850731 [Dreissena polymorpha]KAH3736223.1 hypothetical protein DPMN_042786 [Dreissena polymorpha]
MSRKFTDSEIRAYSKNRHEEKVLRVKIDKLKDDMGLFHDSSAKQRQNLVDECREIRMTTGGSPVPRYCTTDVEFDLASRIQRPWAYSVMETTYNVAYKDAVIPVPKRRRGRRPASSAFQTPSPRSSSVRTPKSVTSMATNQSKSTRRTASSKSNLFSKKNHLPNISDSTSTGCVADQQVKRVISPLPLKAEQVGSKDNAEIKRVTESEESEGYVKGGADAVQEISIKITQVTPVICDENEGFDTIDGNKLMDTFDETINPNNLFIKAVRPESRMFTAPLTLKSAYEINSKDYQEAQRRREISRSRSRVNFSSPVHASKDQSPKEKPVSPERLASASVRVVNEINESNTGLEKTNNGSSESQRSQKAHLLTLDPETMQDISVRSIGNITYKGKLLRNYIRPEERYKIDPIVIKRRQNKMDKLAMESVSFLKKVNHENTKVDIAFPRSERKRILIKLVAANNSGKGQKVAGDDGEIIQQKIEYFMASISDYIRKQQLEREKMC